MKRWLSLFLLLPSLVFSQEPADSVSAFAFDLLRATVKERGKETDEFLAPLTVFLPLESLAAGAEGETQKEILGVLHQKSLEESDLQKVQSFRAACNRTLRTENVFAASRFWVDSSLSLSAAYQETLKTYFNTEISPLDLQGNREEAMATMNAWYAQQTYGKIPQMLTPEILKDDTRLVLGATLYFQCEWMYPFDTDRTQDAPFTRLDGQKTQVSMMECEPIAAFRDTDTFRAVRLPYRKTMAPQNRSYEMVILLPKETNGLPAVRNALTLETWNSLFSDDTSGWKSELGTVRLPKFTMETATFLNDPLQAMGMKKAFDPQQAQFTRMEPSGNVYLQEVLLKTMLEVDEKGTTAAAGLMGGGGFMGGPPLILNADHPFLFVIRDPWTGAILFLGQFLNENTP